MIRRLGLLLALLLLAPAARAQDQIATGTITSTTCPGTGCVSLVTAGSGSGAIQVVGSGSQTLQFEASVDGTNFLPIVGFPTAGGGGVSSTTADGAWIIGTAGYAIVRVRGSAYVSGTAAITMRLAPESQVVASAIGAWLGSTAPTVGQKTAANSLPVTVASDQTAVPVSGTVGVSGPVSVATSDVVATGTLTLVNDAVPVVLAGRAGVGYTLTAGKTGTLVAEASVDGTTWQATVLTSAGGSASLWQTSVTLSGALVSGQILAPAGAAQVRLRLSTNTGGAASTATLNATIMPGVLSLATFAAVGGPGTPPAQALLVGGYDPITGLVYPLPLIGGGVSARSTLLDTSSLASNAIKNGFTPAAAADDALVVGLSPNSPIPSGTNTIGSVIDIEPSVTTTTTTFVGTGVRETTLLASNAARKALSITNQSARTMLLCLCTGLSAQHYTTVLVPGGTFSLGLNGPMNYTGAVTGIWFGLDGGGAVITEM